MSEPAKEPTTVLSLPMLKTPQEAKAFTKKNFGHVVTHCFTVQANPTFSGSVGTGKYNFVISDDNSLMQTDWIKSLWYNLWTNVMVSFLLTNYQIGKLLNSRLAAITLLDLGY